MLLLKVFPELLSFLPEGGSWGEGYVEKCWKYNKVVLWTARQTSREVFTQS